MRQSASVWRIPKPGLVVETARAALLSPAVAPDLAARILAPLDLGPVEKVENVPNGWRNSVVVARVGGRRVVIRAYPSRWPSGSVTCEHSVLDELARQGFPAPRLLRTDRGRTLLELDGRRYAVLSFERGRSFTGYYMTWATIGRLQERAGLAMAALHRALESFHPLGRHHLGLDPASGEPMRSLEWYRSVLDRTGRRDLEGGFGLPESADAVERRLTDLDPVIRDASLPRSVIHGDFGLHNMLFRGDGTAVVHDFELARFDLRAVDVVAALSRVRPQFRRSLLRGLRSGDGIEPLEWELLPQVWEWYRLTGAIQSWESYERHGGSHRLEAVRKRLREAEQVRWRGVDVG